MGDRVICDRAMRDRARRAFLNCTCQEQAHRSAANRAEMGLLVQGLAATASKGNVNETFFAIIASRTGKAGHAEGQIRLGSS